MSAFSAVARLIAVGLLAAICMTACGTSTATSIQKPAAVGGTMTVRLPGDWDSLDVMNFQNGNAISISMALYDRLIILGPGGKLLPYLAKSWKETSTSVTFNLRSDVICSDGTPLTPTAMADSFKALFAAKGGVAPRLFGPGPYSAVGDNSAGTLTITLGTPFSDLVTSFTDPQSSLVCPAGLAAGAQRSTKAYGTGAFVIDSAVHNDTMTLKVRPEWKWGAYGAAASTPGFPDRLVFKVVTSETTAANLLTTGGLDAAYITGPDVGRLLKGSSLHHQTTYAFYNLPLLMNEDPGRPTADERVRQALMTAVDPKAWNQAANEGRGRPGNSLLTSDAQCYDPGTAKLMPQPSAEKAKSGLLAAGWTAGADGKLQKDGKPLTIRMIASVTLAAGPEYVSEQFGKAGITVNLNVMEQSSYIAARNQGNWDVTIQTISNPYPAPGIYILYVIGPNSGTHIVDKDLEEMVKAATATSGAERCKQWANVQRRLLEKHEMLPLASPDYTWFTRGINFHSTAKNVEPTSLLRMT